MNKYQCVCGDPLSVHVPVAASVPLIYREPIYEMPSNAPIAEPMFSANYEQQQCPCGCTIFQADIA